MLILHPLEDNSAHWGSTWDTWKVGSVLVKAAENKRAAIHCADYADTGRRGAACTLLYLPVYQRLSAGAAEASGEDGERLLGYISGVVRVSGLVGAC